MATPTKAQLATARGFLARAAARFNGAAAAVARPNPTDGEFDNNFDGVVTGMRRTFTTALGIFLIAGGGLFAVLVVVAVVTGI